MVQILEIVAKTEKEMTDCIPALSYTTCSYKGKLSLVDLAGSGLTFFFLFLLLKKKNIL
jgi:hypothetical protein